MSIRTYTPVRKYPPIIGLSGKKRSGKDSVAKYLTEIFTPHKCVSIAFADSLKEEVAKACGVTVDFLEINKDIFRPILQWWGTEFRRELTSRTYWIEKVLRKLADIQDYHNTTAIIPDLRYKNEMECLEELGAILIRIERPNYTDTKHSQHASETELDGTKFDLTVVNDGTLEQLRDKVRNLCQTYIFHPTVKH